MKSKIKKGDEVVVICGKDKGKRGLVKQVICTDRFVKLLIEGINLVKKHVKPNPNKGEQGGIITKEALIDISNVKIFNRSSAKSDKIGYRFLEDGSKVRYFKSTGELVESNI